MIKIGNKNFFIALFVAFFFVFGIASLEKAEAVNDGSECKAAGGVCQWECFDDQESNQSINDCPETSLVRGEQDRCCVTKSSNGGKNNGESCSSNSDCISGCCYSDGIGGVSMCSSANVCGGGGGGSGGGGGGGSGGGSGGAVRCPSGTTLTGGVCIPQSATVGISDKSVEEVVLDVLKFILSILAIMSILSIVISGVLYIVSGGEKDHIERAKKMLIYSIFGLVVALLAYSIVLTISDVLY